MPEITHQFTGGKMNKDLDERLIPNGEYRDAMNIQVLTSEGSDVGTVQNILGNVEINSCILPELEEHCVASIADEKNDVGYYFLASSTPVFNGGYQLQRDMIVKFDGFSTTPVFVDPYRKICYGTVDTFFSKITNNPSSNPQEIVRINLIQHDPAGYSDKNPHLVEEGDTIVQIQTGSGNVFKGLDIEILRVTSEFIIVLLKDIPNDIRIPLNYEELRLTIGGNSRRVLNFHKDRLITGVNIIDDMLFWTDNFTEPKKINIERSIQGTAANCLKSTKLIVNSEPVEIINKISGYENYDALCEEKHITVVKKSPNTALFTTLRDITELSFGFVGGWSVANPTQSYQPFYDTTIPSNLSVLKVGDTPSLKLALNSGFPPPSELAPGDILVFDSTTSAVSPSAANHQCKVKILYFDINVIGTNSFYNYSVEILSIDPLFDLNGTYNWSEIFDEEQEPDTFKNKFPRFSYRYKYEDGEYSTFAPFTSVVFSPGEFSYEPKKAYNLGMENTIRKTILKGYKNNTPLDVVQIDLLYKESNSPVVYLIDSIKPNKTGTGPMFWETPEAGYTVKANILGGVLPSNQILRPWDNVPRLALAQEITANRLIYANYLQNYNINKENGEIIIPQLEASVDIAPSSQKTVLRARSLKSLRNYTFGISYLDKFSRESPVFRSEASSVNLSIKRAKNLNRIKIKPKSEKPHWATHYKVFVKDTSNEYYNLSMDRVYEAKDDNIWLSFPSSDRNKVTDETFLILKKDVLSSTPITKKNRYKILAIENEAPDYIKTRNTLVAQSSGNPEIIFSDSGTLPIADRDRIRINYEMWNQQEIPLVDLEKPISIRFSTRQPGGEYTYSRFYNVTNLHIEGNTTDPLNPPDFYDIKLNVPIKETWLTQPGFVLGSPIEDILEPTLAVNVYRKIIENRPEFDGRFFVKISVDSLIETNVLPQIGAGLSQEVVGTVTFPVYFLADINSNHAGNTNNGRTDLPHEWGYGSATGNSTLKFGKQTLQSGWFIDAVHTAGGYNQKLSPNDNYCPDCSGAEYLRTQGMLRLNAPKYPSLTPGQLAPPFTPNPQANQPIIPHVDWPDYDQADRNTIGMNQGIYSETDASGVVRYYIDLAYYNEGDLENSRRDGPNWQPSGQSQYWQGEMGDDKYIGNNMVVDPDYKVGNLLPANFGFNDGPGLHILNLSYVSSNAGVANTIGYNIDTNLYPRKDSPTFGGYGTGGTNSDFGGFDFDYHKKGYVPPSNNINAPHPEPQNNWAHQSCGQWGPSAAYVPDNIQNGTWQYIIPFGSTSIGDYTNILPGDHGPAGCNPNFSWYAELGEPLHEHTNLDIYGQLADVEDSPYYGNNDNLTPWLVGSSIYPSSSSEGAVAQNLIEGRQFRFWQGTKDDTIYTIKNVEKKYFLNFTNSQAVQDAFDNWAVYVKWTGCNWASLSASGGTRNYYGCGYDYMKRVRHEMALMGLDFNRRTVYKIQIDKDPLSEPGAWNPIATTLPDGTTNTGAANATETAEIQFLSYQTVQDEENLQSTNPGMWETEQNADNDLDIYYEISDTIPLEINNETNYDFAPIGTTFFHPTFNTIKYTVVEWDDNHCKLDLAFTAEGDNSYYDGINQLITMNRPDGSIIKARLLGLANPITAGVIAIPPSLYNGISNWIILERDISNRSITLPWYNCYSFGNGVESDRIRDDFNQVRIDKGAIVSSTIDEPYEEEHRKYGLIYSGIYNSNSGVNNLNQFIQAEKITKDVNPTYGSIQKLHARDTDLITLCEDKVLKILANKDAVFNADGNTNLTATANVLGQTIPFVGEFGISTNPESFASESYRVYFTDKARGAVMRLSKDGLTPISMHGMRDWFMDNLKLSPKIIGSYDDKKEEYNITLRREESDISTLLEIEAKLP